MSKTVKTDILESLDPREEEIARLTTTVAVQEEILSFVNQAFTAIEAARVDQMQLLNVRVAEAKKKLPEPRKQ